jgi:myo-inositol-1(or 4)-monophosphatase
MINDKFSNYLTSAKKICVEAGKIVMKEYGKTEISFKQGLDGRPSSITNADKASEHYIVSELKTQFPSHGIYSEEAGTFKTDTEFVWYIDPLDGTTNFGRRIPLFGISIGLVHRGRPVVGVLYFPALNVLVYAEENRGAYANDTQIFVSTRSLEQSLYYISCAESRDGLSFPQLGQKVGWVKAIDASSFELAQIAMGDAEVYTFKNILPHDVVAGVVIVREAGGTVTDENNEPWIVGSNTIIASNGMNHQKILNLIR